MSHINTTLCDTLSSIIPRLQVAEVQRKLEVIFCVHGVLSPLLSNILLDELDKELERRGHRFARYADDANVFVRSRRAGERTMASLERFLWKRLRLRINREKSAVDRPWNRKFLGYSVTTHLKPKLKVARESVKRLKGKLRTLFRQGRGRNLRAILWRQWKRPRTRRTKLARYGLDPERAAISAYNGRGPWWNARSSHMHQAVPTSALRRMGLLSLLEEHRRLARTS